MHTLITILKQVLTVLTALHLLTLHYNSCLMPIYLLPTINKHTYKQIVGFGTEPMHKFLPLIKLVHVFSINTNNLFLFILNFCLQLKGVYNRKIQISAILCICCGSIFFLVQKFLKPVSKFQISLIFFKTSTIFFYPVQNFVIQYKIFEAVRNFLKQYKIF